jgi:D-alanyl-D-alanine carboxypeptidase/D-alanyl-D-alanine-endopeptidase (penicillin-binding protein 4)
MSSRSYARRFVLPLVLLLGAVGAWVASDQLGATDRPTPATASTQAEVDTPLVSIKRVPEFATASLRADAVAQALAALPPDPGGLSCTAVLLDGEPVLAVRPDRGLVPSYAQLLLTAHAAIDRLGPGFVYETQVLANSLPDDNGRIFDGLYLVGSGDPVLMTYTYSIGFRPILSTRTEIEQLADAIVDAGVLRVDGGVIGIERRYDTQRVLPGWPEELATTGLVGPLTALQVDDGFAERAAANLGVAVPAEEPATLAAEKFVALLEERDVQVFGSERTLGPDEDLPSLVPVARISSPPLRDIVFQMLAVNDATAGEMLLKELGSAEQGEGTSQAGGQAVQSVLSELGVDVPVPFRDGSGLDPFGGTTCNQLATSADQIADGHPTIDVLPSYNLPGVFDGRLSDVAMVSDLRLVGGVAGDASGFVARTVDEGPRVTIASVVNRPGGPTETDLAYQRALVEMVDGLRPSVTLEGLGLDDS